MSVLDQVIPLDLARRGGVSAPTADAPDFHSLWRVWAARRHYRAELRRLLRVGAHLIDDIGMSLERACNEAGRPFWRP